MSWTAYRPGQLQSNLVGKIRKKITKQTGQDATEFVLKEWARYNEALVLCLPNRMSVTKISQQPKFYISPNIHQHLGLQKNEPEVDKYHRHGLIDIKLVASCIIACDREVKCSEYGINMLWTCLS